MLLNQDIDIPRDFLETAGFNLTTHDLYLTILVEVFTSHILAKNLFHKSFRMNRSSNHCYKTCK